MELTKEQIQYIDNRLIDEGVKYWDVRIEMLDHIVTDVEQQLEKGEKFKDAIQTSFIALGWKENFNGGGFENLMAVKTTSIGKYFNKVFKQELKLFFTSPLSILALSLFSFLVLNFQHIKLYKWVMISLVLAFGIVLIFGFVNYEKVFKSSRLGTSFGLSFLSLTFLNMFIYIPKIITGQKELSSLYLSVITILLIPFFIIEIKIFFREYKKTDNIYKKLFS